jgi:hypothetical protein
MNDHPAIRLVQYPGEKHGNSRQPGRNDVIHRQIQWFDWYVRDLKPLEGPMPPLDISDRYDLDFTREDMGSVRYLLDRRGGNGNLMHLY